MSRDIFEAEVQRIAIMFGITAPPVTVNNRLRRAVARTVMHPLTQAVRIEISKYVVNATVEEVVVETARHEMAHVIEWKEYNTAGHGARWKEYARILGCVPATQASEEQRVASVKEST